jgi:hypothetical protein
MTAADRRAAELRRLFDAGYADGLRDAAEAPLDEERRHRLSVLITPTDPTRWVAS